MRGKATRFQLPNPNSRGPTISYVQNVFPTSWQSFSKVVSSGGRLFTCCYQPEVHSDSCRRWIRSKIRSGNRLFHVGNSFLFVAVVSTAPPRIHLIRHTFVSFHFDRCNIIQKKTLWWGYFCARKFRAKTSGEFNNWHYLYDWTIRLSRITRSYKSHFFSALQHDHDTKTSQIQLDSTRPRSTKDWA